jgi:hypothetical protein
MLLAGPRSDGIWYIGLGVQMPSTTPGGVVVVWFHEFIRDQERHVSLIGAVNGSGCSETERADQGAGNPIPGHVVRQAKRLVCVDDLADATVIKENPNSEFGRRPR